MKATVLVLDYKRPQNMPHVLASLKAQSLPHNVVVIHQGNRRVYPNVQNITLDRNMGCRVRHHLVTMFETDRVICIDDDITLESNTALARLTVPLEESGVGLVGAVGMNLQRGTNEPYTRGKKVYNANPPQEVDVVLGRLHAFSRDTFLKVYNWHLCWQYIEDDIFLSHCYAQAGWKRLAVDVGPIHNLDRAGGNEFRPDHYDLRNSTARELFHA